MAKKEVDIKMTLDTTQWEDLVSRLDKATAARASSAVYAILDTMGKKMQNYAKKKKPWTNRTGAAVQSLTGGATVISSDEMAAFVAHGVFYGVYLELAHQRRYAILEKAVKANEDETIRAINQLFANISNGKKK